jgi:hypothetical protein
VGVRVSVPRTSGARSLNTETLEFFADTYEAVFRKIGKNTPAEDRYYRGEGDGAKGYISVSVPVGTGYEVLLIAGIGRTLVGAGYVGKNNSPVGITDGKGPVNILPGVVNEVVIEVEKLAPQWNTKAQWFADPDNPNDFNVGMIPDPLAKGGDVSFMPGETPDVCYEIHTFKESNALSFKDTAKTSIEADVLVVVGGGGAAGAIGSNGQDMGGGAGAGGLWYEGGLTLPLTDGSVTVTVGKGGVGGASARGGDGGASSIGAILTVPGGGGGGKGNPSSANDVNANGRNGGSGGGSGALSTVNSGTPGQAADKANMGDPYGA